MKHREPDFFQNLQDEFSDGRAWLDRSIVLAYAIAAGLFVVAFTWMSETAFEAFKHLHEAQPWAVLIWTPCLTAFIVWATRRFAPGAAGSGIPQVMAALDSGVTPTMRAGLVSLRLTFAKMILGATSLLAGLSAGREGPSVQVAAGVMHDARRWLRPGSAMSEHALLVAGGAAGIAAAFNAPLAGVVFSIEELSKKMESRNNGLIIAAIVVAGLVAISVFGNLTYFGTIVVPRLSWHAFWPGLLVAVVCGVLGGLFSRLLAASLKGLPDRVSAFRRRYPVRFAAAAGLAIGVIGLVTGGATFGAGAEQVRHMLAGESELSPVYVLLKLVATWLTSWSGVPGGIFAPSLSIGGGIGNDVAMLLGGADAHVLAPSLIALGMAGFLAATTQAPLTSFIIVMEMINGRSMVLSLMAAAMLSSLIARLISRPLYSALAAMMTRKLGRRGASTLDAGDTEPVSEPAVAASATPVDEAAAPAPATPEVPPASEAPPAPEVPPDHRN
ncbi:MAG: chloride channel protein [Hydrogenophaga sp.]|uniref:chloride channel protein n=1 Tax=Hydrogenophaga sp. TaxID=1904254 RepID=UPI001D210F79|nr:chloride channel protein [Hydrogenophaga sp.]MBX3609499.1 chloride channel protein [Hydrogenophaga sp.]